MIHAATDPKDAITKTDVVFIGGGNTFRLLKALYDFDLLGPIRERVEAGMPYVGSSAIERRWTNDQDYEDMPIVQHRLSMRSA